MHLRGVRRDDQRRTSQPDGQGAAGYVQGDGRLHRRRRILHLVFRHRSGHRRRGVRQAGDGQAVDQAGEIRRRPDHPDRQDGKRRQRHALPGRPGGRNEAGPRAVQGRAGGDGGFPGRLPHRQDQGLLRPRSGRHRRRRL